MVENAEINATEDEIIDGQITIGEEKSKAIAHKNSSLKRLDMSFNQHIELLEYKKSHLLAYWIEDFANYHDSERNFNSSSLKTFKRGDIIKVNLGFNVGNELGGLHYCIVLDKKDNPYSGTLNVIPLSSIKEGKTYDSNTCVNLGDELYSLLLAKYIKESKVFDKEIQDLSTTTSPDKTKALLRKFEYLQKINDEITRMKHGSIAYIHQITTISKQRIFKTPILSGIKISNESLDLIDKKIIKMFTK